jgi:flagellar hook-length control protein FliK
VFALQLTETPVATGAKGPRATEAVLAPTDAVKPDFHTYLGLAQTAVAGADAGVSPITVPGVVADPAAPLRIERLPQAQAVAIAPEQTETLVAAQPAVTQGIPERGMDADLTLPLAVDTPVSPEQAVAEEPDFAPDRDTSDLGFAPDRDASLKQLVFDQEVVPERIASPDTETGPEAKMPDLPPSDIPDHGLPQSESGIPSDQTEIAVEAATDALVVPVSELAEPQVDLANDIVLPTEIETITADIPERIAESTASDPTLETDAPAQAVIGTVVAGGAQMDARRSAGDIPTQPASSSLNAEARQTVQPDTQPRLQTLEQPVGDAAFSRILTEVSVAAAPATTPVQTAQQSATPVQVQTPTPLDMSQPNWAEKLVEDVSVQPMGRGETLTLTLTPERLGTMQVRLEMQDGQTHVHFITETPEAARLLTEAQPRLADLMSRAGVDLGGQSATSGQGSQQNDRSAQGGPMQDGAPAAQQETTVDSPESSSTASNSASRSTVDVVA